MNTIKNLMDQIATEAHEGVPDSIDRASPEELREFNEQELLKGSRVPPSYWDMQRRMERDHIMGRGPKPLDGSCLDRRDNGVLDD